MKLGEMTYSVTHFYFGTVEASGQLYAPADLSPSNGPLVPIEKESRWEMSTSRTPQQNVLSSRTNNVIFICILSGFLPCDVSSTWRQDFKYTVYGSVNISELRVTKHKILTHIYPERATLFPRWSKGNENTRKRTCRPLINSIELLVIIIYPFLPGGHQGNWHFNNTGNHRK